MDLKYLATIKAILETGSFQKAATRLNYTQSTVTFQVRQLEAELRVQLFERVGRRMVLTQAGQEILPYIENYAKLFGVSVETILAKPFYRLSPNAKNPYKRLYTVN